MGNFLFSSVSSVRFFSRENFFWIFAKFWFSAKVHRLAGKSVWNKKSHRRKSEQSVVGWAYGLKWSNLEAVKNRRTFQTSHFLPIVTLPLGVVNPGWWGRTRSLVENSPTFLWILMCKLPWDLRFGFKIHKERAISYTYSLPKISVWIFLEKANAKVRYPYLCSF